MWSCDREEDNKTALLTMNYTECCKELFFSQSNTHKKILESNTRSIYTDAKCQFGKLKLEILFVQNLLGQYWLWALVGYQVKPIRIGEYARLLNLNIGFALKMI